MTRGAYWLAQFGNRAQRKRAREMLVESSELPGGEWKVVGDHRWRTGTRDEEGEAIQRAMEVGSFGSWRSFGRVSPLPTRGLWVQLCQLATEDDAKSLANAPKRRMALNKRSTNQVTEQRLIIDQELTGIPNAWVYEQLTIGPNGPGATRMVSGNVEQIYFMICASETGGSWSWSDVATIVTLQSEKIRKVVIQEQ